MADKKLPFKLGPKTYVPGMEQEDFEDQLLECLRRHDDNRRPEKAQQKQLQPKQKK